MPLTIFVAGLSHETNSFSPLPTSLRSFEADVCYRPGTSDERARAAAIAFPGYGDALRVTWAAGDTAIEGPCFWTQPSGPMAHSVYEHLRDTLLAALDAAGPVDAVILNLHGAMMAQGVDDCEGDLLTAVRARVGPDLPVGVLLDLHGNVSPAMLESSAVMVGVKEYPHVDYLQRAVELHALLTTMAGGSLRPRTLMRTIPVLGLHGTIAGPMRDFVDRLMASERQDAIVSVTMMHGFAWSDSEDTGASVLVIHDGSDEQAADALADDLADAFVAAARTGTPRRPDVADAVREAMDAPPGPGPVMIADSADNPGGGAACDSTFLLAAVLAAGVENAAVGMIWDPQAARIAADAGVGARLPLRVGGKVGPLSGPPLDLDVEVLCVRDDARQCVFSDVPNDPLGLAVTLRCGGVDIVVNSQRQQVFSAECFSEMGIEPAAKALIVVKSSQHFRASFDPFSRATVYCDAPGTLSLDLAALPYRKLTVRSDEGLFKTDRPIRTASSAAT